MCFVFDSLCTVDILCRRVSDLFCSRKSRLVPGVVRPIFPGCCPRLQESGNGGAVPKVRVVHCHEVGPKATVGCLFSLLLISATVGFGPYGSGGRRPRLSDRSPSPNHGAIAERVRTEGRMMQPGGRTLSAPEVKRHGGDPRGSAPACRFQGLAGLF